MLDLRWRGYRFCASLEALYPKARHFILCLVLVQPRESSPDMTEKNVDWDVKNRIKQKDFTVHYRVTDLVVHWMQQLNSSVML